MCRKIAHETKREKRGRFQRKKRDGKRVRGKIIYKKRLSYPINTLLKQNQLVKIRRAKSMIKKKRPQN